MTLNKKKLEPIIDYEPILIERLKDPNESAEFLNAALEAYIEDKDLTSFNTALKYLLEAQNKVKVSQEVNISRQHLYRIINGSSKVSFTTMISILSNLGFKLEIKPNDSGLTMKSG